MFIYEPPCNDWDDRDKPMFIKSKIEEICRNIASKGEKSAFTEIFDYLYEHIEDNIEKFLPDGE